MERKGHASVAEMLKAIEFPHKDIIAEVESTPAKCTLIRRMASYRIKQGLSQKDIALKMGCTQSRISKLEAGSDDELKWGEIRQYLDALGLGLSHIIFPKSKNLLEQATSRANTIRRIKRRMGINIVSIVIPDAMTEDEANDLLVTESEAVADELQTI